MEQLDTLLRAVPAARKVSACVGAYVKGQHTLRPARYTAPSFLPYFLPSSLACNLPSLLARRRCARRWPPCGHASPTRSPSCSPTHGCPGPSCREITSRCRHHHSLLRHLLLLPAAYYLLLATHYSLLTTHYSLRTYCLLHYLEVPPLPALADLVAGGADHAPPRARPPRRQLLHGTAMGHEDGPALAPGSQPTSGEAHAAPDALDTIIMFLAGRVDLDVRPTSTPQL